MFRITRLIAVITLGALLLTAARAHAYQVPFEKSKIRYFYVFGKDGDPYVGAEDNRLELFIDVPENETRNVTIRVFDPDTGGRRDWKKPSSEWNTITEFALYGNGLLEKKEFGFGEYDNAYYTFGPYSRSNGKRVGSMYRFTLIATGLSGDDENLFKVSVSPDSAETFVENITFRLLPTKGDKMYFYPEVQGNTSSLTVENYDLDINGGRSVLLVNGKKHAIKDSLSAEWSTTDVDVDIASGGRLVYEITKVTQKYANAGLRIKDSRGNAVPIYFRKGTPPAPRPVIRSAKSAPKTKPAKPGMKCNKFTFDARSSYDVDKQNLSYLWEFGDGSTSEEPVVTHVYEKGGEYTVKLTVTDDSGLECDSNVTTQRIYVNTPPVAKFTAVDKVCLGEEVSFNASATKDDTPNNLSFNWLFGDGSKAEGSNVAHTYKKGGDYKVTLKVDDNSDTECSTDYAYSTIKVNSPPAADAGSDIEKCLKSIDDKYAVILDGSRSKDPDGDELIYFWDFGDGNTTEGKKVTHEYDKSGSYTARLTVSDSSGLACSSNTDSVNVKLNKPPLAAIRGDTTACVDSSLNFDGSGSQTESGESLSYHWDFGDGHTATDTRVSHKYDKGGIYKVVLTVDDRMDMACSTSVDIMHVKINSGPSVDLGNVDNTCVDKTVSFDASGSDPDKDPLTYSWDLGDGTTKGGGSRITHKYSRGGTYRVSVTADDGRGSGCSRATDSTTVRINTSPDAKINMTPACCVDMEQTFDASGSSDPDNDSLTYRWDFGDGSHETSRTAKHVYSSPGTYRVTLTVDDNTGTDCSSDIAVSFITVNAKPVAVIKIRPEN